MAKQKMSSAAADFCRIEDDFATKMPPQMGLKIDGDFKSDFPDCYAFDTFISPVFVDYKGFVCCGKINNTFYLFLRTRKGYLFLQVDKDGAARIYGVKTVNILGDGEAFNVYPNPVTGNVINVRVAATATGKRRCVCLLWRKK